MSPNPSTALPIPDFNDGPQNILRDEILGIIDKLKVKYDQSIVGVVSFVPVYFNFGSVLQYNGSDRVTVLRSVKTNVLNICKQFETSMDKMDALNKANVNQFLVRMVVNNVPGKASTSKKAMFYPDGTFEISTVFEDALNCQYYLEKKILQTLNEFRPAAGAVPVPKVQAFSPETTAVPVSAEPVMQVAQTPSAADIDLSIPSYPNPTWENLKGEIIKVCVPMKVEGILPGPHFEMPVCVDWLSIPASGNDYSTVLKSMKTNIPGIVKQIVPAIVKVDDFRKPIIRDFLVTVVFQNVAGKASTSKKCFLSAEGALMVQVPFEDSLNCSYYFEKKITQGLNEFAPPSNVTSLPKVASTPAVVPTPVVEPPKPVTPTVPTYGIGNYQVAQPVQPVPVQPVQQVPVYQQIVPPVYQQHVPPQPQVPQYTPQFTSYQAPVKVEPPKPVYEPPKPRDPPKDKGRPEMSEKPKIEDPALIFLVREIEYIVSQMKVVDEKDQYFGVPVYVDWASIMVYPSAVKQATIIRNVNLVIYRILRDVLQSVKLSCTDGINKDNIVEYLRSVTIHHEQGSSPSLKKVTYEDGHLILQTTFEDFGNCALYFESKIIQALGSKPTQPTPKKADALTLIKEELPIRLMAHQAVLNKEGKQVTPSCPVEFDFSFLTVKGMEAGVENNLIASTNPILTDLFNAILTFTQPEIDILMKETTKVTFYQAAPGKTIFEKRTVCMLDNGHLQITSIFEDKLEGGKTFKEKFICIFKSRLFKVTIRDRLVPEMKAMIDTAVKVQYKANYLDNIPVKEFQGYSSTVLFDWQLVDKEPLPAQVDIYAQIVANMEQRRTFPALLDKSIRDICSYDVGKNAFLSNTHFILRNLIKFKEEAIKFTTNNTWEFYVSFHDPSKYQVNAKALTRQFKETLLVAFPCAIQDTFPIINSHIDELAGYTGKKVPIVQKYDSWRNDPSFASVPNLSYLQIDNIACQTVHTGLDCIGRLCKDEIVKREFTKQVNTIEIYYDTADKVSAFRRKDPNVVAKLANGVLAFTINFSDGRSARTQPWDFQFEYVLGTRPLKIQRSIENAKPDLAAISKAVSNLVGKTIDVSVNYAGFIKHREFELELEEPTYTKVIASFHHLLKTGWVGDSESSNLLTYESLKKAIQGQLSKITFHVDSQSSQRDNYEFKLVGDDLSVGLNLGSATQVATMSWRLELERVFKLRDLRVQEHIAKRVDFSAAKAQILKVIGKQSVALTIDWQSLTTNGDFSRNLTDYCVYINKFSENICRELAQTNGFGKLCEYSEVQALVQQKINSITVQASSNDGFSIQYSESAKHLVCLVGVRNLFKHLDSTSGNYEQYGRKIENAIGVRVDCIKAFIKRQEPSYISAAKAKLVEATEHDQTVQFDWASIINHPKFNSIQDPVPTLKNILKLADFLHAVSQICKENLRAKAILKSTKLWTIEVDGNSRINESEFEVNKYGVDWCRVAYKNPPAKEHIVFSANLEDLVSDAPYGLDIHYKVEALVTPDDALERVQRKEDIARSERQHRDQMRMDERMLDASRENNRQLENLNRKLRR